MWNGEGFARAHIQAWAETPALAAYGDFLGYHPQGHAVNAVGAGVPQRQGHVQIQHQGRAAAVARESPVECRATPPGESLGKFTLMELSGSRTSCASAGGRPGPDRPPAALQIYLTIYLIDRYVPRFRDRIASPMEPWAPTEYVTSARRN